MKILFVNRLDKNMGDFSSSPLIYFDFSMFETSHIDICDKNIGDKVKNQIVILGGGGLFSPFFKPYLHKIFSTAKFIFVWGVGINDVKSVTQIKKKNFYPLQEFIGGYYNNIIFGLRDNKNLDRRIERYYIPCCSCMDSNFIENNFDAIEHDLVTISHKKIILKNYYHSPYLINNLEYSKKNMKYIIDFIKSAKKIFTNSYHVAYWATLLQRQVLVYAWSPKFFFINKNINFFSKKNFFKTRSVLLNRSYYHRAVKINKIFYNKILNKLNNV